NPIWRACRSKRRLISRETSCTRKPKLRPNPECAAGPSVISLVGRACGSTVACISCGTSLGAMTALRQSRPRGIGEGFLHARRAVGAAEPAGETFEIEVDNRGCVECQPLREQQPADDRDAERPT